MSPEQDTAPDNHGNAMSSLVGSTNDLAADTPRSRVDQILQWVPRILSSKPHVVLLMGLGVYLIVLPILGVTVSANTELIGGNYTNVTSDIGACIAAGGTLHLVNQSRKRRRITMSMVTPPGSLVMSARSPATLRTFHRPAAEASRGPAPARCSSPRERLDSSHPCP